ncbi:MAG: 1-acyl-sn-glycerol-3-phosphate acyltransferase [Rubellimicrobium sp.]|nr:1-acyl-sn-glycerol-3-phosphate acyltransferase [Rubellimicrobium sp.]
MSAAPPEAGAPDPRSAHPRAGGARSTWDGAVPPPLPRIGPGGWLRVGLRGAVVALAVLVLLPVIVLVRLVERALPDRPRVAGDRVAHLFHRIVIGVLGITLRVRGRPLGGAGVLVANHSSWLDIVALNAVRPLVFVAKAEVAGWPGIGLFARLAGTLFIRRDRAEARDQVSRLRERLSAGEALVLFAEGTSTDGQRVLPFKPTLLAALFDDSRAEADTAPPKVQPVTLVWTAPKGADPRFYGWWGEMALGPHLLTVLAAARQGGVLLVFHPPLAPAAMTGRKAAAAAAERAVRAGLATGQPIAAA